MKCKPLVYGKLLLRELSSHDTIKFNVMWSFYLDRATDYTGMSAPAVHIENSFSHHILAVGLCMLSIFDEYLLHSLLCMKRTHSNLSIHHQLSIKTQSKQKN